MRVEIPEKNNYINFPDDMSREEIQKAIDDNWDSIPARKTVLGKSADVLSAMGGDVLESVKETPSKIGELGKQVLGLGEAAGAFGTGLLGSAAGGVVGLRKLLAGEDAAKAEEEIARIAESLTYQPQTEWGKHFAGGLEYGMGLISKAGEKVGETVMESPWKSDLLKGYGEPGLRLPESAKLYAGTAASVITQFGIFGLFGKLTSRIKDPKQRVQFEKDIQKESVETGKSVDEVAAEKIKATEPIVDIPVRNEDLRSLAEPLMSNEKGMQSEALAKLQTAIEKGATKEEIAHNINNELLNVANKNIEKGALLETELAKAQEVSKIVTETVEKPVEPPKPPIAEPGKAGVIDAEKRLSVEINKAQSEVYTPPGQLIVALPERAPKFKFTNAETEARFEAAKGIREEPLWNRVKDTLESIKHKATREYEHLPRTKEFAQLRFDLLNLAKEKGIASDRALRVIQGIASEIKDANVADLYRRKVILDDLLATAEKGKDIPFGFTADSLKSELGRIDVEIVKHPEIVSSLKKRKDFWDALKGDYVQALKDIGFDVSERLTSENYFRHQVLDYAQVKSVYGAGKKLKIPTGRGFLKERKGSERDINTDYLQAETEVMAQMIHDIKVADVIRSVDKNYNIADKVKVEAKEKGLKDWREAIPEGYFSWQSREGSVFYLADTIPAKLAEQLKSGALEEVGITGDLLKQVLAMGRKRKEFVLKNEIIETIDNLSPHKGDNVVSNLSKSLLKGWKVWTLISPRRLIKYNIRNMTGDADAVFIGNPSGFKKTPQAVRELYDVYAGNKAMTPEMKEWFDRGGMQSTLQFQEMGDINQLKIFKSFLDKHTGVTEIPKTLWNKYWTSARLSTDFREAILRYSNYLDFKEQMTKNPGGKPNSFGASIPEEIMGLKDIKDRAFWLSNDLLGAYDRISVMGQYVREHLFPFWSWKELNFKRYIRFAKNAADNGELASAIGKKAVNVAASPYTYMRIGGLLLKATGFWAALHAWNNTMFLELEKGLSVEERNRPHIILGKTKEGKIINFTRIGALGDFLQWFGLDATPKYVDSWMQGKMTLKDIALDMAKSPLNAIVQGITPFAKVPAEIITRRSLFPDVTRPGTIRDRWGYIARNLGMEDEYKSLTGKPSEGYWKSLDKFIVYETDPLQTAYHEINDLKNSFRKKIGKGAEGFWITPRGNALYNMRLALRYKDEKAFTEAMVEYAMMGGTKQGIAQSIRMMHPLSGLSEPELKLFVSTLKPDEQERLVRAFKFYQEVLKGRD